MNKKIWQILKVNFFFENNSHYFSDLMVKKVLHVAKGDENIFQ